MSITLGGRKFIAVTSGTIEWDATLFRLLQGAGLSDVTMHSGETPTTLAQRIYRSLMGAGQLFEILGCVYVPETAEPAKWSPKRMAETADFIRQLSAHEDKEVISTQIVALVTSFFRQGLLSIRTSPSSSGAARGAEMKTTTGAAHAANSTSANGA